MRRQAAPVAYEVAQGTLYARFTGADFEYSIPFAFIIQGAALAIVIAVLWEIFFGEKIIKKWRFFKRTLAFNFLLVIVVALCFLTSFALPTDWAYLWLIGVGTIAFGIAVMSGLNEIYYRQTGKRYNEMLKVYHERQSNNL